MHSRSRNARSTSEQPGATMQTVARHAAAENPCDYTSALQRYVYRGADPEEPVSEADERIEGVQAADYCNQHLRSADHSHDVHS